MANTISDKLTYLEGTKSAIKDAIVAKGVAVSDSDTFRSYADKIGQISGVGGGKINLNDYGLTFAHSSMTQEQYNNIEYSLPDNINYWFDGTSFISTIDISSHIDLSKVYNASYAFQNTYNIYIDNIRTSVGDSDAFSGFQSTLNNLELINTLSSSWNYAARTFFNASNLPTTLKVINEADTGVSALQFFFYSVSSNVPEIEVINGQLSLYNYFSSYNEGVTTVGKIKLNNCTLAGDLNRTSICASTNTIVTYFGGVEGADKSMNLANFRALNSQSVTDIITNVSDLTGKDTKTLTFYTNIYNALTEEQKSLATSKNWTLASSN